MKTIMKVYTGFVVVMAMVGRVCADTINIDNIEWTYTIIDDKVTLGGGNASSPAIPTSTAGDIVIPELICGCPVVSVEAHAFQGCSALTSVSIPDSIEIIGEQAFSGCTCLTNICFGSGVKNIGDDVFYHCTSLRDLTIPNSVTNIGRYMVSKCTNLKRLTLPFIGSCRGNIFSDDAVFGHIFARRMDSGLVKTESQYGYNSVVSYLPLSLKEVRITDETVIAKGAFDNCSNIVNVVINDGIHYIGDYAFAHCKALRSLEVPNSVTNIGRCVFADCGALESMTLPFIGSQRGNLGPKNPNADHYFGAPEAVLGYVFGGEECTGMVRRRQSLGWDDNWVTAYFPIGLTSVTITDESVVSYGAFYGLYMLTNVTLNAGIEKIGPYSFRNCSGLRHVRIPDTVYKLENAAFRGSGLETLLIPLSVSNIELGECGHVFEDSTSLNIAYVPRRFKGVLDNDNTFANCAPDLQIIYYDENMKFFDETLTTDNNSSTSIVAVCTNDCRVSFKWKCSCEPLVKGQPYDYLSFEIDGIRQDLICGETDWQTKSYEVPGDGEHVFRWIYQKDEEDSAGEDCGWVKQVVVAPRVTLSFNGGGATGGTPPATMSFYANDESVVLPDCGTLVRANHSFAGWSDGVNTYAVGSEYPVYDTTRTLTATWAANTLSAPVITAPETYEADSATVTISADDSVTVYYTLDGSTPKAGGTGCRPYLGPFEIEGSAIICAIAVRDNYYDSEVASFTVTRPTWTFGEYLNCPGRTFTTGGDAEWVRAKGVSTDGFALRSGAITHSQTSRLETVVYGAGTVTFQYKVDGEILKKIVYDGLAFCIDGVQQGDLMGENVWTNKSFTVTGDGRHTLSWLYVKDEEGNGDGEDCAWLDNVVWAADDPLPPLDAAATDSDAKAIIAGLSDVRLSDEIGSTTAYMAFRSWVDNNCLSHALVKDAPNAWLSYMLDAPLLMAKTTALTSEDIVIESIEPSSETAGAFELVVDIASAEIGAAARLAETLGVEGAPVLDESAFSSEGLFVTLERTADGKVKATVTPEGTPPTFFLRVKVK